jgi:hypothetical protein
MGLPGKPDGISSGRQKECHREGKIKEIAECYESDWLTPIGCGRGMSCFGED